MDENKSCPNCSQLYQLKCLSPTPKGNIPLFLSCGHSMCENCIKNIVHFGEPIECKICHHDMEIKSTDITLLTQGKTTLHKLFPVNVNMLGELTLCLIEDSLEKQKNDCNYFIDLQSIMESTDDTQGQCIECHNLTTKMCVQCATVLCDTCFNKTHKNFIVFKNHMLQNIEAKLKQKNCKTHIGKPLDYYCKDCLKSICMDCMMLGNDKSCKNHNVVLMQEVNEGFLEDLHDITPKVDEIFRRLTKTAVDIGNLLHNLENDTGSRSELTQTMCDIEQHFSKLQAAVQKHKYDIMDKLTKLKSDQKESLIQAKNFVGESIKKCRIVLNTLNAISDPKKIKQMNLAALLDEAKLIADTPWYLSRDATDKDPLKAVVNEDLCSLMMDYIHLEGNANVMYKLRSSADLGEGEEVPPPPNTPVYPPELPKDVRSLNMEKKAEKTKPILYKDPPKYRAKSGSVTSLNSIGSDSSKSVNNTSETFQKPIVQQVLPFAESKHPTPIRQGMQELIYISHIVDPHNFFVQRACHQSLVKEMLKEFRNATSLPKPSAHHVTEGKLYLVFNKADSMWQRCRVVSIDRRAADKPVFHVFCIDFGSIEAVTTDNLRLLPPARVQSPLPLAINCSLANCEPKDGTWTSDDSFLIQNIIDNKQAVMHVRRVCSASSGVTKLECDVTTLEAGVSIAHALVFHERARMPNAKLLYPKIMGLVEKPKLFISNNDFKAKSVEEVYITHIISPDNFYVRKRHFQDVYEKLCEDMELEYSMNNSGTVHLPEIGMVCAVNIDISQFAGGGAGGWLRGVVRELPGRGRVRIYLPDIGATIIVLWTALKYIHPKFTTLKGLATECHLAGVTPVNRKWSPSSVALLEHYKEQLLELYVDDNRGRGSIGVTLYCREDPEEVVCINNEMIKYKFAVSFGISMFNTKKTEAQVMTNKSCLEEPKPEQSKILKKEHPMKEIAERDLKAKDKGPLRLEGKVLHYQSPSLIYVSLIHQQKAFTELFENMQKYYAEKKPEVREWKDGDRCCAFCDQSKTWRRAVIVELQDQNAKVFYTDFACPDTVPINHLTVLTPEFAAYGDAAIKCHISGVIPAVGEEWPSLTKEYLKELLDAYKRVFITKSGNFINKSMPVEIWVYHTIQGGALEPDISEWRCLNKKIIEQGLGIPDKSQENTKDDEAGNSEYDILSFLNLKGSIHDWLQLEPLPTKSIAEITKSDSESRNCSTPREEHAAETSMIQKVADASNTIFISNWLPPEPLICKEFTAMPTYIDNEGIIYLHDVSQQDTLDLIRKALDVRFKDADPKAKYAKWTVGEPCIAMFFLDNRFYRGRIMDVNNENSTCLVHYIDYGNEEICSFANLRKSIALYEIPIQAHKCFLDRIGPTGNQWDRTTLDYIHKSIVEKQCFVKVTGEPIGDVIPIELKYDKLWINDHLVDFELAVYSDGSKAVVRRYAPPANVTEVIESDSEPDYIVEDSHVSSAYSMTRESFDMESMKNKDWNTVLDEEENQYINGNFITYPKNEDEFLCKIVLISDVNTLHLSVVHNDETNTVYEEMFENIQEEGGKMPPLKGIFENKACISLFHEDGLWYRASILQYSEAKSQLKVLYVDYGNIEIVSLSDVREIHEDWILLPPANVMAKLYGVEINPDVDIAVITAEYKNTLLDKGMCKAKIVDYENVVPLVELKNEEGDLAYEKLFESGIFLKSVSTN